MNSIGGYIDFEINNGQMLYEDTIKLNCARKALEYLIIKKEISSIFIPYFLCESCYEVLISHDVEIHKYEIDMSFRPILEGITENDWIYIVNYYGQISNDYIHALKGHIIFDNVQEYFQKPIPKVDTIYSCRKYFGVTDGAILASNLPKDDKIESDVSFDRMRYLFGRYEIGASEFYEEYKKNNDSFRNVPILKMSKVTENILKGIDYEWVRTRRRSNFQTLHEKLKEVNKLKLTNLGATFAYPLMIENASQIRSKLMSDKIYVPQLWPNVLEECNKQSVSYRMANDILPLPIDQRYDEYDMNRILESIFG